MSTFKRLTKVFETAEEISFNDSSKFILMSDCHRGDGSWADNFARNRNLFKAALNYYYERNFIYIEIGDGDELWENTDLSEIKEVHTDVFLLIKKFYNMNRFYMIWGNHDRVKKDKKYTKRNLYKYFNSYKNKYEPLFEGIKVHEGLVLKYKSLKEKILVIHGHQGDLINDSLWPLGKLLTRYFRRTFELFGLKYPNSPLKNYSRNKRIENRITKWIKVNKHAVIAGHTHRPSLANAGSPPYFNAGSCVNSYFITGIEIENGEISLVKWSTKTKDDGILYAGKEIIQGPKKLVTLFKSF